MNTETHCVVLGKLAERKQRQGQVQRKAEAIASQAMTPSLRVQGWAIDFVGEEEIVIPKAERMDANAYRYRMKMSVQFMHQANQPNPNMYRGIVNAIGTKGGSKENGFWEVLEVDGEEYEESDYGNAINVKDFVGYATIDVPPEAEFRSHFSRFFGLDHQISRLYEAISASAENDYNVRSHCLMVGPPGCGKTDVASTLKTIFGPDAVMTIDGGSTTPAGLEKALLDLTILPRFIVGEELDKVTGDAIGTIFLSLMDLRAEVNKTTAKQNIQRDARVIVIASVNDIHKFRKLNAGAWADRFGIEIAFRRPNRATLERILEREVSKLKGGDVAWIKPCMDYCEAHGIENPRAAIKLIVDGRSKWVQTDPTTGRPVWAEVMDATTLDSSWDEDEAEADGMATWEAMAEEIATVIATKKGAK